MTKTHWKRMCNPDYIGAYALEPNEDKILTIKEIKQEIITGPSGKKRNVLLLTSTKKKNL